MEQLTNLHIDDLPYIERDLSFAQKVSVSFLLYGDDHSNASYILQKLLTISLAQSNNVSCSSAQEAVTQETDLLRRYALINPTKWPAYLVEALCIIGARRVLRKMGFDWQELRLHYLPHIKEVTLYVHPLLKVLYLICEQLTLAESGRLVMDINDKQRSRLLDQTADEHLRFYEFGYLEIFMLDWLTRRVIKLGDINAEGSDMQILIEYFKFNDMHRLSAMLIDSINSNATAQATVASQATPNVPVAITKCESDAFVREPAKGWLKSAENRTELSALLRQDAFKVRRENAGILLIINQEQFHRNVSEDLQPLLPKMKLAPRLGTDTDKDVLTAVFGSFGYTVESHNNVDHLTILACIRDVCARSVLRDSLIVCILSHGFEGAVYGSDSIPLSISEIENVVCADNLRHIPKMLIIQACQQNDKNMETRKMNTSTKSPQQHANLLKAMSTVPGYVALRDTIQGSWFIQSLCQAVVEYAPRKHMLDILTHVIRLVSKKRGQKNQVMCPQIKFTLTQPFYLPAANQR